MALIDSDSLAPDELNFEDVTVESLGGDVRVRSLDLVQRFIYMRKVREVGQTSKNGDEGESLIPELLETCVFDVKNRPVKSAAQWSIWGSNSKNFDESVRLFNVALRVSGMAGGAEDPKN